MERADPNATDPIYVANAGLVLLSPFLPALFDRLKLLSEVDGVPRIIGVEAASRAVHLLQYLVDGRLDCPAPHLALNKVVCGLPVAQPVSAAIAPAASDLEVCDGLLGAVINNWPVISSTSVAGLRETFLQRDGRLMAGEDRWSLTVGRKTLDVLVDQAPWSFSVLFHPWMVRPIHVTW